MGSGFAKKKKQAQQMQQEFARLQEMMASTEVEGSAGGRLVTLRLNGEYELLALTIKPECVDAEDVEGLEDLIKAAFADALKKLGEQSPMNSMANPLSALGL